MDNRQRELDRHMRYDTNMRYEAHEKVFGPLHEVNYRFEGYADEPAKP